MSTTLFAILSLLSFSGPAGGAYMGKAENQAPEMGYSVIRYDLDHHNYSIPLAIHKNTGCVITFSRPYDDSWASDANGSVSGEFYKYAEWGTDSSGSPNYQKIIVSSVLATKTTQNLFILIGNRVLEFVLKQTDQIDQADRKVVINLVGQESKKARPKKVAVVQEPDQDLVAMMALLPSSDNQKTNVPHGNLIYQFDRGRFFVYFTPEEGAPEIETLEIVRGRKSGKLFQYEVPIKATQDVSLGRSRLLTYDNFELEKREHVYIRIKVKGERVAKTKRLHKRRS